MCPDWQSANHINKAQGWALFKNAIENIGTDYFGPNIDCIVCGKKFSLQQGVSEAFASDIVINDFRHNSHESGKVEVIVGNLTKIQFIQPFLDIPEINLTPYLNLKPVDVVSGYITSEGFAIFSSADTCSIGEKCQITWHASGNHASAPIPLWRMLLSSAKEHQKSKNYRSEIVELESAFEVFVGEYLGKNLQVKLRQETVNWFLKRSIEEELQIGFIELNGTPLKKLHEIPYRAWVTKVKQLRDAVVHQGINVTAEQAKVARKAVFDLIVKIDNSTFEQFQIQMADIGVDAPHSSFGRFTGTGKRQAIAHNLGGTPKPEGIVIEPCGD